MTGLAVEARMLWRARQLVWVLTQREFTARHVGAAGGVAWAYAQPLLMVAAYYLVFDVVLTMRLGDQAPTRSAGVYLIVGSVPWMAFCDAVQRAMSSLLDATGLLQKNALPPALFPARAVVCNALVYAPLMAMLVLAYAPLHHLQWPVLLMAPLLLTQALLCWLLGYSLAIMAAALRDVVQLTGFALSVGIFLSPVLFPMALFPEPWRWVLWMNPMSAWVVAYQGVLLQGQWPPLTVWCVMGAWLMALALLLNHLIRRSQERLVDWL